MYPPLLGSDGLEGSREVIKGGGQVVVQDEASSVVWGMPGAVASAGLAHAVLPLNQLAAYVLGALRFGRTYGSDLRSAA